MLSDIISAVNLDTNTADPKFIVVTKDLKSDLNFVFCEILSYYIKNNYAVVLVNFAQSSNHYNHLLLKSGINVRTLRDQQKFIVIDALSDVEKVCSFEESQNLWLSMFSVDIEYDRLKELYLLIKKSVDQLKSADESRPYIIFIDEISILLNTGINLKSIEPFIQYCASLSIHHAPVTGNVLLIGTVQDIIDDENIKLANFLKHLSDIKIEVEGLKTGYSKDADGKISFCIKNKEECKCHEKQLLFKVSEKGAKLLTSGL